MITQKQMDKSTEVFQELVSKAWENASFKDRLISNPEETIREIAPAFKMPASQKIVVEDQSDDSVIYLNIPRKVTVDNMELSDEQLETVSGGIIVTATIVAVVSIAAGFGTAAVLDKYF
ncbi:nitrile hydratase, alpha chain [Kordia sp. SMS9]|uniref:NHLP leader peptide family RiPP precursor n=1 Tax=Kordia sp. SMS9 TaxID=2282170 RepID=UPI000E0D0C33|nr:NHLP leader peptide family RiPP precursor [Kordia sp. SMS9]AXG69007.1 nitrile hydratase, alpha chain [Kordia sp. SMS9]